MDQLQDSDQVKADIKDLERLKEERAPWEATWRDIDERFPSGDGGFTNKTPGAIRGERNFDSTHVTALERFAAAGVAITTPEEKLYIRPQFSPELQKLRSVELWCEHAGQRLYAIRHAAHTGFTIAANEDWDQLGRYGTSPMWSEARPARGLFYKVLHLSSCYIDVDFAGLVDTLFRTVCWTARQCEQFFGKDSLTPKMIKALAENKPHEEFELVHIVMPNTSWDRERLDWRRFPIAERFLALDEKLYLRRRGFSTMPVSVSRHMTSPGEKYGRSPAIKMMPNINGVNAMRLTTLRAGHKAVDPALVFYEDAEINRLSTKPGGLNAGLVDEGGRLLVHRLPGGEAALPYAAQDLEAERGIIRTAFLEEFYKILTDPNSRMTTTEVLEVMAKQGVLVRPYAGRYAMEKQAPVSNRDLALAMEYGQIDPFPPEVLEAGEWPQIDYENMLAAMAKAEATGKTLRFLEAITPFSQADGGAVLDYLNTEELIPGMAAEIGVKPSYIRTPEQVAEIRKARADQQQQAVGVEQLQGAADAYQKIAKGNQLSEAA
ncbi:portal protein [Novosphingobium sp.]|uniref:portal protein n=1 Tax=Novosphingobium sp. TaxID=1874826 RepID=UPI0038BBD6D7